MAGCSRLSCACGRQTRVYGALLRSYWPADRPCCPSPRPCACMAGAERPSLSLAWPRRGRLGRCCCCCRCGLHCFAPRCCGCHRHAVASACILPRCSERSSPSRISPIVLSLALMALSTHIALATRLQHTRVHRAAVGPRRAKRRMSQVKPPSPPSLFPLPPCRRTRISQVGMVESPSSDSQRL
jgi:hypothetical protein